MLGGPTRERLKGGHEGGLPRVVGYGNRDALGDSDAPRWVASAAMTDAGRDGGLGFGSTINNSSGRILAKSPEQKAVLKSGDRTQRAEEGGVFSAVRIILGTTQSVTFFSAVVLSGMSAGVIDTFLFIR